MRVGEADLRHEIAGAEPVARVVRAALRQRRDREDTVARAAEPAIENLLGVERDDGVRRARRADRIGASVGVAVRVAIESADFDVVLAAEARKESW